MPEVEVGRVTAFFARPVVAGIALTSPLRVGDTLRFKGHTTDFTCTVESMQIHNRPVEEAGPGQEVGVKVPQRVRPGDRVYKVVP